MTPLQQIPAWQALQVQRDVLARSSLRELMQADPMRFDYFSAQFEGAGAHVLLDYSKQRIDRRTMILLDELLQARALRPAIGSLFGGAPLNTTEGRAVMHMALRGEVEDHYQADGTTVMPDVLQVRERMLAFVERVRGGQWLGATGAAITDVVNIGIGGSDLGPQMMVQALEPYCSGPRVHFVSNVDGAHLSGVLKHLDAARTLFVIASKTFTTQETMANARSARAWLVDRLGAAATGKHFVAVSTNGREVAAFGIDPRNMFGFWDWVGGRYSVWSSIGLPVALALGSAHFRAILAGARAMDLHFRDAPFERNLPVLMAAVGLWNINFLGLDALAIAPYAQNLSRFAAHLQQLDMESNGKRVQIDGQAVSYSTGPLVFGEPGTNAQHAYFQWLHQGPKVVPVDFILAAQTDSGLEDQHRLLAANCFAQSEALLRGKTADEVRADLIASGLPAADVNRLTPHRSFPGDRPSSTLLVRRLDPATLGALLALYEHKVFVQGLVWGINSFDQWGVELGKQLAAPIAASLQPGAAPGVHDASTLGLMQHWKRLREG
ncbi:MAG TPA: glucose-6-phosphate isomerase [Burkholderiaceae bacterium]|nr:glucose-6-phosphate isomerase [Burkholderiaceae bacterium]